MPEMQEIQNLSTKQALNQLELFEEAFRLYNAANEQFSVVIKDKKSIY